MNKRKIFSGGKGWGQVQIGTSSLVLIFTVLALTVFSTLSLASARSDLMLAEKNRQAVMDYYQADGEAEIKLRDFEKNPGMDTVSYMVSAGAEQFLSVELEPVGELADGRHYKIVSWRIQNKVDYQVYDELPVWDGSLIQ